MSKFINLTPHPVVVENINIPSSYNGNKLPKYPLDETGGRYLNMYDKVTPCEMCFNARLDDELTDDNDLSYVSVGKAIEGHHMYIGSGDGKPLRITVSMWDEKRKENVTIAAYYPKYCPNCGREIIEYGGKVNEVYHID